MEILQQGNYSGKVISASVSEGLISSVTAYSALQFNNVPHCHENAHFSFVLDGGCIEKKKEFYEIKPGHITYYSPGEMHQVVKIVRPARRINMEVEESFFRDFDCSDSTLRNAITNNPDAKFLMLRICRELLINDSFSQVSMRMLLLELIGFSNAERENEVPKWVSTLTAYLHDHDSDAISLKELSQVTGLHPVTISRKFPKYFRCTLGEYKRKLKVERSLSLIKSGQSLTNIAYECGFFDQSHFIRTFKQLTNFLPLDYKKL